jgi:hypothetical protein
MIESLYKKLWENLEEGDILQFDASVCSWNGRKVTLCGADSPHCEVSPRQIVLSALPDKKLTLFVQVVDRWDGAMVFVDVENFEQKWYLTSRCQNFADSCHDFIVFRNGKQLEFLTESDCMSRVISPVIEANQ